MLDLFRVNVADAQLGHDALGPFGFRGGDLLQRVKLFRVAAGAADRALAAEGFEQRLVEVECLLERGFVGLGGRLGWAFFGLGAGFQEGVIFQFSVDSVEQLGGGELQDLHGLNHLRRLDKSLFESQILGVFQAHECKNLIPRERGRYTFCRGKAMEVLLVEDEKTLAIPLADALREEGHQVTVLHEGPAALAWLAEHPCDLLVTDVRLPGADGIQILERARKQDPPAICLVMTGYATVEQAVDAMKQGALSYLQKPFPTEALLGLVRQADELRAMRDEIRRLRAGEGGGEAGLTGDSLQVRDVQARIAAAAASTAAVLISGASGTGKERVARAIHRASERAEQAFVPVACAAIPENLLEGELFGFRKGAFTGADEDHEGLFAQAGEGTLFLDDVEDLPLEAQAKLLRVLQEREYTPLGSPRSQPFHAAVVAATKADLPERVKDGAFREDLYYRLNVVPLHIPPLRERAADIPVLLGEFLARHDPEGRYRIAEDTLRRLAQYEWPGNVRELENSLRRAMALSGRARVLRDEHFFPGGPAGDLRSEEVLPLREVVRRAEAEAIRKAMAATGGRKIKAAELLGISRKVMWQKMKDLGLSGDKD